MPTLKDLARHVGVSVSTVSMALRNHPSIGKETTRKVWQARKKLGYQIRTKSGDSVAFLLFDRGFDQPVYARFFESIGRAALERGMHPVYLSLASTISGRNSLPPVLNRRGIGGMIVSGVYGKALHEGLSALGIPLVALGVYDLGDAPWAACEVDIPGGIRLAMGTFKQFGHRRIGLVVSAPQEREYGRRILQSFLAGLEAHGLESAGIAREQTNRAVSSVNNITVKEALLALLKKPDRPTAILIEKAGAHIYEACEELGLRIPQDVSFLSLGLASQELHPSLAAVESNPEEMGRRAFEKLLRMINDPGATPTREIFSMSLIPGQTIGRCPSGY